MEGRVSIFVIGKGSTAGFLMGLFSLVGLYKLAHEAKPEEVGRSKDASGVRLSTSDNRNSAET